MYNINDRYFNNILRKIENGVFERGNDCRIENMSLEGDINDYLLWEKTPEISASLINCGCCRLDEIPMESRTREFYIATFTNDEVYDYIKTHPEEFDRQFFKDLLVTNEYATHFDKNCFEVMSDQYIDEEMCSLGIIESTGWANYSWFESVFIRNPEAISEDVWRLAARLYSGCPSFVSRVLSEIPGSYQDVELYKQMCRCHYRNGIELKGDKQGVMNSIPKQIITPRFLLDLVKENPNNLARFNEYALDTELNHDFNGKHINEKIWQFLIKENGILIEHINLNEERVKFFLSNYGKDSIEYILFFKNKYRKYKRERDNKEGFDSSKNRAVLPIKYYGVVPIEFLEEYDSEEYLEKVYKEMGIQIIDEEDDLFYSVLLPQGWCIKNTNRYWSNVKDEHGNNVIKYFFNSKFYARDAYVQDINPVKGKVLDKK